MSPPASGGILSKSPAWVLSERWSGRGPRRRARSSRCQTMPPRTDAAGRWVFGCPSPRIGSRATTKFSSALRIMGATTCGVRTGSPTPVASSSCERRNRDGIRRSSCSSPPTPTTPTTTGAGSVFMPSMVAGAIRGTGCPSSVRPDRSSRAGNRPSLNGPSRTDTPSSTPPIATSSRIRKSSKPTSWYSAWVTTSTGRPPCGTIWRSSSATAAMWLFLAATRAAGRCVPRTTGRR